MAAASTRAMAAASTRDLPGLDRPLGSLMQLPHPRWELPKVWRSEALHGKWQLERPDLLNIFLVLLPKPLTCEHQLVANEHNNTAELFRLVYGEKTSTWSPKLLGKLRS